MARRKKSDGFLLASFNGMAYGYFCSVALGSVLIQFGQIMNFTQCVEWGHIAQNMMGVTIGVAIAYTLEAKGLTMICAPIAGAIGASTYVSGTDTFGHPIMAYLAVVAAVWVAGYIDQEFPFAIFIIPTVTIGIAAIFSVFMSPYILKAILYCTHLLDGVFALHPIFMCMLISLVIGVVCSSPISAIAVTSILNLQGIAAGAALAGCCCHMLGFAAMSMEDNDAGDVIALAIGTSMLQLRNILRKPLILVPPMLTSLIIGPISGYLFSIASSTYGAGVGNMAFIGLTETIAIMGTRYWLPLICVDILLPFIICFSCYKVMKSMHYLNKGDLRLYRP